MTGIRIVSFTIRGAGQPAVVKHTIEQLAASRRFLFRVDEFRPTTVQNDSGKLVQGFAVEMSTTYGAQAQEGAERIALEIQSRAKLQGELTVVMRSKRINISTVVVEAVVVEPAGKKKPAKRKRKNK